MAKAPVILEEGFRARSDEITGWMCMACNHYMTYLALNGGCANCQAHNALYPVKSKTRLDEETDALTDKQRFHPPQREFDPFDPECQMGRPMTEAKLLEFLRKFIPGTVARPVTNGLHRQVIALYVPNRSSAADSEHLTDYETKNDLRFVCCAEAGLMPEWDVVTKGKDGRPAGQVRGWRSVLGTFYRAGLLPFIPDEGKRLSYWQIRESRNKETRF